MIAELGETATGQLIAILAQPTPDVAAAQNGIWLRGVFITTLNKLFRFAPEHRVSVAKALKAIGQVPQPVRVPVEPMTACPCDTQEERLGLV